MTLKKMYEKIEILQAELQNLQPLKLDDEGRLWKKFRLEWNYNSNHMEGNTLSYGHTELLLIFDKVVGDYTGREIEEMKAHDVAIKMVVELATNKERDLSENFIRQLNEIILVRPYWKEAITNDGQQTRREITPGEYKKFPNSVRLENGEIFQYASPQETPALMNDLMDFYKTSSDEGVAHPLWLAAMLHYKFVRIHPFDDGNGRVARLLMNHVLIKNNLPPVIIKDADKKKYITALNKADAGDLEAFVNYIGEQLVWSQEIKIKAAKGESIEEPGDIDKEIKQAKTELKTKSPKYTTRINPHVVGLFLNELVTPGLKYFYNKLESFDDEFLKITYNATMSINGGNIGVGTATNIDQLIKNILEVYASNSNQEYYVIEISLSKSFGGFTHHENAPHMYSQIRFKFSEFYFECLLDQQDVNAIKIAYNSKPDIQLIENKCNEAIRLFIENRKSYLKND
jgi:Fic family protein